MATIIPCSVDTTPMAAEIQTVSNHVKGTTAAVVTMQSAVIAAENNSANKVCSNVNRGFFTLMQSQISQKIANKQSRVEALLMHLAQQKRQLLSIKTNMEREYGRIASRYIKIFTSINKELEQRIQQVDQPVFELVNKHMSASSNRMNAMTSWATTSQTEGLSRSQQILVSNMKYHANNALKQSASFLRQVSVQRALTEQVLISNPIDNRDHCCMIPVMISEAINNPTGIPRTDVAAPEYGLSNFIRQINDTFLRSDSLPWQQQDVQIQVKEEFARILDSSHVSPRIKNLIQSMYDSADFETL